MVNLMGNFEGGVSSSYEKEQQIKILEKRVDFFMEQFEDLKIKHKLGLIERAEVVKAKKEYKRLKRKLNDLY